MTSHLRHTFLYSASLASLLSACGKNASAPAGVPAPTSTSASATQAQPAPASTATAPMPAPASSTSNAAMTASAASPPPAPAVAPISVVMLTLGTQVNAEHQVTRPGSSFAADDRTIYASVATTGNSGGATLNAKWTYLEGQPQLVSNISQSFATEGSAVTTFKVQNPDLWPEGRYQVEISLDGKPVAKRDFEIKKG